MPAIVPPSITKSLILLAIREGEIIDKDGHLEIATNPGATLAFPSDAADAVHRVIIGLANGKWSGPEGRWGDYITRPTNRGGGGRPGGSSVFGRLHDLKRSIDKARERLSRRRWSIATQVAAMPSTPLGAAQSVAEFLISMDEDLLTRRQAELSKLEESESSKAMVFVPSSPIKSVGVTTDASKVKEELAAIRVERERQEEARQREESAAREVARRSQETKRALELAAYGIYPHLQAQGIVHTQFGPDVEPVGAVQERITISSQAWATRICIAARAFAHSPGLCVLDERPIRDVGVGIDMGKKLFLLAANGESDDVIAQLIDEARTSLGSWHEGQGRPLGDSELGLWAYFRHLDRYYNEGTWTPPLRHATGDRSHRGGGQKNAASLRVRDTVPPTEAHPVECSTSRSAHSNGTAGESTGVRESIPGTDVAEASHAETECSEAAASKSSRRRRPETPSPSLDAMATACLLENQMASNKEIAKMLNIDASNLSPSKKHRFPEFWKAKVTLGSIDRRFPRGRKTDGIVEAVAEPDEEGLD